jgi:hypothetical protein
VSIHFNPVTAVPSPLPLRRQTPRLAWVKGKRWESGDWYLLAMITTSLGFYKVWIRVDGAWLSEALGSGVADKLVWLLQGMGLDVEVEGCEVDMEWESLARL